MGLRVRRDSTQEEDWYLKGEMIRFPYTQKASLVRELVRMPANTATIFLRGNLFHITLGPLGGSLGEEPFVRE